MAAKKESAPMTWEGISNAAAGCPVHDSGGAHVGQYHHNGGHGKKHPGIDDAFPVGIGLR